jgi:hypothetical protein
MSDHDPLFTELKIDAKFITQSSRIFTPRVSWVKASDEDVNNYRSALSHRLASIKLSAAALLCTDTCCKDASHHSAIGQYSEAITKACLSAAESNIPHTSDRHILSLSVSLGGMNGLNPSAKNPCFGMDYGWTADAPCRNGVVADCMRRARSDYHYAVRQVKRVEDLIVRDRIANALIVDPSRSFWTEVKKIRSNKACSTKIVDGCTDENSIAQLLANKYSNLFSSVPYDAADMQDLLAELDVRVGCDHGLSYPDHIFTAPDVADAIKKLNAQKNDGSSGCAPKEFGVNTIIPIPKKRNANAADSNNYRGIPLSSVFLQSI